MGKRLTWDDKRLATHDEQDLHWSELAESHLRSLPQSVAELSDKNDAKPEDTDSRRIIGRHTELQQRRGQLIRHYEYVVFHYISEATPDCHEGDEQRDSEYKAPVAFAKSNADDPDLKAQRHLNAYLHKQCADRGCD